MSCIPIDDEPEFSRVSWLTMLFAAGMGVGLLFWGTAGPLSLVFSLLAYQKKAGRI
jgi:choline-glycine betaine transporter